MGKELVRMSRFRSAKNSTRQNVVVPPLIMMLSSGPIRAAAACAIARFSGALMLWLIANGRPTKWA